MEFWCRAPPPRPSPTISPSSSCHPPNNTRRGMQSGHVPSLPTELSVPTELAQRACDGEDCDDDAGGLLEGIVVSWSLSFSTLCLFESLTGRVCSRVGRGEIVSSRGELVGGAAVQSGGQARHGSLAGLFGRTSSGPRARLDRAVIDI